MGERRERERRIEAVERALPCNLDAEKSVIGSLLIQNAGYLQVSSRLESRHFFRDAHRRIYGAMEALLGGGKPADIRLLLEELERRGEVDEVGGPAYVASMVDGVPAAVNIRYYADIVREKWALRQIAVMGRRWVERAYAASDPARDVLAGIDQDCSTLAAEAKIAHGAQPLALSALSEELDRRVQHRGQIIGYPSGFPSVDLLTHGWQPRKAVVLAGQTSFGKSVLALNWAKAIAEAGGRVVYYSYEMEKQELEWRLWSALAEVPLTRMGWGNVSDKEYAKLAQAQEAMHALPIEINDSGAPTIAAMRAECRQIKAERGLAAVVADHLQLMDGPGDSRVEELAAISKGFKGLTRELEVTGFGLSQLTLSGKDADREPYLDDIRDCKSIGHDADIVFMLHPYHPKEARTDIEVVPMKLLCRKQRGGGPGLVTLNLERDYTRFVEAEAPAPKVRAKPEPKPKDFTW